MFSFVAKHLLRQRTKSRALAAAGESTRFCPFRGPGGLMCAAGCLVPDSDYDPEWEHEGEIGSSENRVSTYFARRGFDLELLVGLQQLHDNVEVGDWPRELQSTAEAFGLCPLHESDPRLRTLCTTANHGPLPAQASPLP